jgi:tetratricopeptide (TPR) repeat protein
MCRSPLILLLIAFLWALPAGAGNEPHWTQVSSAHFSVLTDAEGKKAAETLLRFEQMRAVFGQLLLREKLVMSEPLNLIGFKTTAEYAAVAPGRAGQPSFSGSFVPGDDRNYVLLDLSDANSWQTVSRDFARVLLRYNYPPTPPWFDEGFADYFSSLRLDDKLARIGGDPASFLATLKAQPWLPIQELFTHQPSATQAAIFRAQSWMVVHYLISNNKLPETGTYFGLVELQKVPVEQAIQQAYGVTAEQFSKAIKDHFGSFLPSSQASATNEMADGQQQFPTLTPNDVGTSSLDVPLPEAEALVAEAALRQPDHRAEAVKELQNLASNPKTETAAAHRALAWAHLQDKEYSQAMDELADAIGLNHNDPWARYYLALAKYREGKQGDEEIPGLANMMQDLRAVIDWNPEFAEAYDMLAMARLQGGGTYSGLKVIQTAIQLSPRNQTYVLHLARIDMAAKKWDEATELLNRLESSPNAQIAGAAKQSLQDMPTLRKYGVLPQRSASSAQPAAVWSSPPDDEEASADAAAPSASLPDRRKTEYLQGKLLKVDCSNAPIAIVSISAHGQVRRFRTEDYKSLTLIGTDEFSCEWKNQPVVINYKAGGKSSGDLVSLEIR